MARKRLEGQEVAEVERKDRQNDTLQRQIRKLAHQAFDAEKESETLKKRRINLEELIENRKLVCEQLCNELQEQEYLLERAEPLHGLDDEARETAQACIEVQERLAQIEEEKLETEQRLKAMSSTLDKKVGVQRIKITLAL